MTRDELMAKVDEEVDGMQEADEIREACRKHVDALIRLERNQVADLIVAAWHGSTATGRPVGVVFDTVAALLPQ